MAFFDAVFLSACIIKLNMAEKFYKNEKFQKIFYPILYLLLLASFLISGCFIFVRSYYTNVYISGSSMMPSLLGGKDGKWNYGISDNHKSALRTIKRFDVVLTYYPNGWAPGEDEDTTYKIKRVWGFPGETISLTKSEDGTEYIFTASKDDEVIYSVTAPISKKQFSFTGNNNWKVAEFELEKKTFVTHADTNREFNLTLSEEKQEYFVMGDNWSASSDSFSHISSPERLTFDNLQGKMIAIQGIARLENGDLVDKQKFDNIYYF